MGLLRVWSLFCIMVSVSGQCNFPTNLRGDWHSEYLGNSGNVLWRVTQTDIRAILRSFSNGAETIRETRVCQADRFNSPLWYHQVSIGTQTRCLETFITENVMIMQESGDINVPVSQCSTQISALPNPISQVLVKSPIDWSLANCPFPNGRYQLTIAEDSPSEAKCDRNFGSILVVNGFTMTITSCLNDDRYDKPWQSEMRCLLPFSPNAIGDDSSNGDMIVLAKTDALSTIERYYCGRYNVNNNGNRIILSIGVNNPDEAYCEHGITYNDASNDVFSKHRRMTLIPSYCEESFCKNGATCTSSLGNYNCICTAGWTGKNCDVDIAECASNPCMNGGTCNEGMNGYTCTCPSTHQGNVCQSRSCQLPLEWSGMYWKEFEDSNYRDMTGYTFTGTSITISSINNGEETWICEADDEDAPYHAFTLRRSGTNIRKCAEAVRVGTTMDILLFRESAPETRATSYSVAECSARLGEREEMDMLVADPFLHLSFRDCPWPQTPGGVPYHTEIFQGTTNQCGNDPLSVSTASGIDMDINSCFQGRITYRDPFMTKLQCVDNWPATITDGSNGNGDYVAMVYEYTDGQYLFVCAKYIVLPNEEQVLIAFDTTDAKFTTCKMNSDYIADNTNERGFVLTANLCGSGPCQNGATCVDRLSYTSAWFTCTCRDGFTGTLCQTNIDDCAVRPCENGGRCDDGINSFTCVCSAEYYGDRCQYGVCNMGVEYRLPKNYWTNYVALSTSVFLSFNKTAKSTTDNGEHFCEKQLEEGDSTFSSWWDIKTFNDRSCQEQWFAADGILLSRTAIVANSGPIEIAACKSALGPKSTDVMDVFLEWPLGAGENFPASIPSSTFQVTVNERQGVNNKCASNPSSEATVTGNTISFIVPCYNGESYELPFNSNFELIRTFPSEELDGQDNSGRGDVMILAYTDPQDVKRYYCARYRVQGIQVMMSFDTADATTVKCAANADYNDFDATYRAIILTSNLCSKTPCLNGGTCTDLMGDYTCQCQRGFTGRNCDININECASLPCYNGGTCRDGVDRYTCDCRLGYSGLTCLIYDECISSPCRNGGVCSDLTNNYQCACTQGWRGKNCDVPVNECLSNPCQNGGTCRDLFNSYDCSCTTGYSGRHCEININECASQPCQNGGTCLDRVDGYYCRCTAFYIGLHCEQADECGNKPCRNGGTCNDDLGFAKCFCPNGYTGDLCEIAINPCASIVCQNGGTCETIGTTGYRCNCQQSYSGNFCQIRDPCSSFPCQNSGICSSTGPSVFTCNCQFGYTGYTCAIPPPVDYCQSGPCQNGGRCTSHSSGYTCQCFNDYSGTNCQLRDPCSSFPCQNSGICSSTGPSVFTCNCQFGYTGYTCAIPPPVDYCQSGPCQNGGRCTSHSSGYTCQCFNDYTGTNCQFRDPCSSFPCLNGGTCSSSISTFTCRCPTGYTGFNCAIPPPIDYCLSSPCFNGGRCTSLTSGYTCQCNNGYTGANCQIQPVPDYCLSNPCRNGATCYTHRTGYTCNCISGYSGTDCSTREACVSAPCQNAGRCTNINNGQSYTCECVAGYTGPTCSSPPIRNLCTPNPCNQGVCASDGRSIVCSCNPGWSGARCTIVTNTDYCASGPCNNNGACRSTSLGYICTCNSGYRGANCDRRDTLNTCDTTVNQCLNGATCQDNGQTWTCVCALGWTGQRCSTSSSGTGTTDPPAGGDGTISTTAIILIAIISFLILAVIIVVLVLVMRRRNRKADDEASLARSNGQVIYTSGSNAWYPAYKNGNGNGGGGGPTGQ